MGSNVAIPMVTGTSTLSGGTEISSMLHQMAAHALSEAPLVHQKFPRAGIAGSARQTGFPTVLSTAFFPATGSQEDACSAVRADTEPAREAMVPTARLTEPAAFLCLHNTGTGARRREHSIPKDSRLHRQVVAQPAWPMLVFRSKRSSREGLQQSCSALSSTKSGLEEGDHAFLLPDTVRSLKQLETSWYAGKPLLNENARRLIQGV